MTISEFDVSGVVVDVANGDGLLCTVKIYDIAENLVLEKSQRIQGVETSLQFDIRLPGLPAEYTAKAVIGGSYPCEAVPVTKVLYSDVYSESRVSGIFVAPEQSSRTSAEEWNAAMQNMRDIGIDNVIIQYCHQSDSLHGRQAYFHYAQEDTVHDTAQYPLRRDQIEYILSAAQKCDIKVYLGLQLAEREWFDEKMYKSSDWLREQYIFSVELANSLWDFFGNQYNDTIVGWYLPFEFMSNSDFSPYMSQLTYEYYRPLTDKLKSSKRFGDLTVIISPLIYQGDDIGVWQKNLETVLSDSQIDILAIQDGIGYGTQDHESVVVWFRLARKIVDEVNSEHGKSVSLWGNCENYSRLRNPNETDPIERIKPMSISKFITSLDVIRPYTDKIVTFSIHRWDTEMLQCGNTDVNRSYYEAYKRYHATGEKPVSKSDGYYVNIYTTQGASVTFNPQAGAGLTDGFASDPAVWEEYKGISTDNGVPFIMEIRFDDPTAISSVTSHFYEDAAAAIALPKEIIYEYLVRSGDNDEKITYFTFHIAGLSPSGSTALSRVSLSEPVMADGVRLTIVPEVEWTFIDDIWIE